MPTAPSSDATQPVAVAAALSGGRGRDRRALAGAFDAGHVAGSVNIPAGDDAAAFAMQLVARDVPVLACGERSRMRVSSMADQLGRAGFRHVLGAVAGEQRPPRARPARRHRCGAVGVDRLAAELATGAVLLVDVRDDWEAGGARPGSVHLPLASLRAAAHLLPAVPTVTACSDGRRAAAAASALRRFGHRNVWRLAGAGVAELLDRPIGLDLLGAA